MPLALPLIFAGVRTATVYVVATATLATFAGGGGLGDIIVNEPTYGVRGRDRRIAGDHRARVRDRRAAGPGAARRHPPAAPQRGRLGRADAVAAAAAGDGGSRRPAILTRQPEEPHMSRRTRGRAPGYRRLPPHRGARRARGRRPAAGRVQQQLAARARARAPAAAAVRRARRARAGERQVGSTLGTKNFTEEFIVGALYQQALQAKGYKVVYKPNIGATEVVDKALTSGQIDAYPEYTGESAVTVAGINTSRSHRRSRSTTWPRRSTLSAASR